MKEILIEGKYATAKCFVVDNETNAIDTHARAQIKMICDDEISKDAIIRVMPDVHAGKVGPIGLTMKLTHERIIPNLLGNDLGCGITVAKLRTKTKKLTDSDFTKLDKVINETVPSGTGLHKGVVVSELVSSIIFPKNTPIDKERISKSIGTLGGGNHFIEVDKNENGEYFLVVHSGSRSLGPVINDYYNKKGQEILKSNGIEVPYEMTYITDDLCNKYIRDVFCATRFASFSRNEIIDIICKTMKWKYDIYSDIPHNYFDPHSNILHKGSISCFDHTAFIPTLEPGSMVFIPINMGDGIIYGSSMSNSDWNYSLPHGSGRLIPRSEVANSVTVSSFKKEMKGIYSTSVRKDTLDESPFAYRRIDELKEAISGVVDVKGVLTPVYNFKAGR